MSNAEDWKKGFENSRKYIAYFPAGVMAGVALWDLVGVVRGEQDAGWRAFGDFLGAGFLTGAGMIAETKSSSATEGFVVGAIDLYMLGWTAFNSTNNLFLAEDLVRLRRAVRIAVVPTAITSQALLYSL